MKILYIANIRIPTEKAHGHQIFKMCDQYCSLGCEVELLVANRKNHIITEPFLYYKPKNRFKISYINSFDFLTWSHYFGRLRFYLQDLFFLICLFFYKTDKTKIVLTRSSAVSFIMYLKGHKVFFECHDWLSRKTVFLELFFIKHVNGIIATNKFIGEKFIENGLDPMRILIAPNGVDLEIFDMNITKEEAIHKLNIDQNILDKTILMYTGSYRTMDEEKGLRNILIALSELDDDYFFIAVGGSDADIEYYKKLILQLNIAHRVMLIGKQDQYNLAIYQQLADIMLMPFPDRIHYKFFMSPLKTFEYMASKKPIIASSLPSIKEILNSDSCFFVESDDVKDLKKQIIFITNNQILAQKKALLAQHRVREYTWQKRAVKIINFISFR